MCYYEGEIPCHLFIVDETVLIGNNQPEVVQPCEFVETDDETGLSWARENIESYRSDANRLGPEAFAQESPAPIATDQTTIETPSQLTLTFRVTVDSPPSPPSAC